MTDQRPHAPTSSHAPERLWTSRVTASVPVATPQLAPRRRNDLSIEIIGRKQCFVEALLNRDLRVLGQGVHDVPDAFLPAGHGLPERHPRRRLHLRDDALDGHLKPPKTARSLSFFRYLRSLYPTDVRLSIVHNYTCPRPSRYAANRCRVPCRRV